jgi:hypothetical protein
MEGDMKIFRAFFVVSIISLSVLLTFGCGNKSGLQGKIVDAKGQPIPGLTADKDGIITAAATGLQWYIGPDKDTNWDQANSWVNSLSIAGGGWRMPTRAELRGLYDAGMRRRHWVWSGETSGPTGAWPFNFGLSREHSGLRLDHFDTRAFAVRSR